MGDRVDQPIVMSDNGQVREVQFVSVNLRVIKRAPMPSPEGVEALLSKWRMFDPSQESVWVLAFDTQGFVRKVSRVAQGSYDSVDVPIAAVLTAVAVAAADRFWLVHNHPGGSAQPSPADIDLTIKMVNAANVAGMRMEDHIILAPPDSSFSFAGSGIIRFADGITAAAANEALVDPVTPVVHRTSVQEVN